jgi:protein TonB
MKTNRIALAACTAFIFTLPACSHAPSGENSSVQYSPTQHSPTRYSPSQYSSTEYSSMPYQRQPIPDAGLADRRASFNSVDDYKLDAAIQIAQFNAAHTFSGRLPPKLKAVVVLRITVDESGRINDVWVQRAPEGDVLASNIAMASMHRAGVLPRPLNLAHATDRSLSYSETFLFNADNQFQLRTLAPVQTPDLD